MHRRFDPLVRTAALSALAVAIACGGARESELFATDDTSDGGTTKSDTGTITPGKDSGAVKDTSTAKAPIEIAQFDVNKGDKGRIAYQVRLRNVSTSDIAMVGSIELAFAGGGSSIFQINCAGKDWQVTQGSTDSVPAFSTTSFSPAQTELVFECNGSKQGLQVVPAIAKYGVSPVQLTLRGTLQDGTEWFATASTNF